MFCLGYFLIIKKIIIVLLLFALGNISFPVIGKEIAPGEEGPKIINQKAYFSGIRKECQSRATKIKAEVDLSNGGVGEVSGSQVNYAWDCGVGKNFTCQVINCINSTMIVLVHSE
jgi:hypothetical protein